MVVVEFFSYQKRYLLLVWDKAKTYMRSYDCIRKSKHVPQIYGKEHLLEHDCTTEGTHYRVPFEVSKTELLYCTRQ